MTEIDRVLSLGLVGVGGFAGAASRHAVAVAVAVPFPVGTLLANVLGSFLLGLLLYEQQLVGRLDTETRLLVGTGFCSSFTTYSTFAAETGSLGPELAATNVVANYVLGFLAVAAGHFVARWFA